VRSFTPTLELLLQGSSFAAADPACLAFNPLAKRSGDSLLARNKVPIL
jgi:hypothetical protein